MPHLAQSSPQPGQQGYSLRRECYFEALTADWIAQNCTINYRSRMVRRRSSAPIPKIPADFITHDGAGIPLSMQARPALIFRGGTRVRAGIDTVSKWASFAECCWRWQGKRESHYDIVAYKPEEDELIEIQRLA